MQTIEIIKTKEIKEVENNIAHDLIDSNIARLYIKKKKFKKKDMKNYMDKEMTVRKRSGKYGKLRSYKTK